MTTGFQRLAEALDRVSTKVGYGDRGNWLCPAHDDRQASLSLTEGDQGRALLYCHAGCDTKDVVEALGLTMRDLFSDEDVVGRAMEMGPKGLRLFSDEDVLSDEDIRSGGAVAPSLEGSGLSVPEQTRRVVAQYVYTDEQGEPLIRVTRFEPKGFTQERRVEDATGYGYWAPGLEDTRRVLYNLPKVKAAAKMHMPVYIVEGEKDADALTELGLCATTWMGGASNWRPEYADVLKGASPVTIIPDNDEPGLRAGRQIGASLEERGIDVQWKYAAAGKDASDHLAAGFGVGDFLDKPPVDDSIFEPFDPYTYEVKDDEWLWRPFLPASARILIHGESGALKTLWCMWAGHKLAEEGKRVAFFSTEMNKSQTAKRMRNLGRSKMKVYSSFMLGMNLETAIRVFEGYDLLIIDSWSSTQGGIGSNDNDAISNLDVEFLQPLIAATGASVLIIDNTGKDIVTSEGKVKQTMARGASRKRDIQEVELWMSRPDRSNNFRTKIECTKMRMDVRIPAPITVETAQDVIDFYLVENGVMTSNSMWTVYHGTREFVEDGGDGEEQTAAYAPSANVGSTPTTSTASDVNGQPGKYAPVLADTSLAEGAVPAKGDAEVAAPAPFEASLDDWSALQNLKKFLNVKAVKDEGQALAEGEGGAA